MQRYEGVREYFSHVREEFVVKVVRFEVRIKVRCRLGIGVQI